MLNCTFTQFVAKPSLDGFHAAEGSLNSSRSDRSTVKMATNIPTLYTACNIKGELKGLVGKQGSLGGKLPPAPPDRIEPCLI